MAATPTPGYDRGITLAAPGSPIEPPANYQALPLQWMQSTANFGASVIDILGKLRIRLDSVKRMTQIQNTS